nr:MAG TPA: hypothetical protein [Caudoviricetes sp.]
MNKCVSSCLIIYIVYLLSLTGFTILNTVK